MTDEEIEERTEEKFHCNEKEIMPLEAIGYKKGLKEGAEFGYNKANEWHYVKDELPKHNGQFYVALKSHTETFILNYDYDEYDESKMAWLDDDDTSFDNEVYAWHEKLKAPKEIV